MSKNKTPSDNAGKTIKEHVKAFCVWPDGTSCHIEELEQMLHFMSDDYRLEHDDPNEQPEPLSESEQERFSKELEDYSEPNEHVNNMPDERRQRVISKYYKCLEPVFGGGFMFSTIGAYSISAEELRIIADYIDEKEENEHEIPPVH